MRDRLRAPMPCPDQARLLDAFDLPTRILQDAAALERVTRELVEDVAGDGTRYAEIRWGPTLHELRGMPLREGIAAVVAGARAGSRATGVVVRLIAVAIRTHEPDHAVRMAEVAAGFREEGLTGFDLAGLERTVPGIAPFLPAFDAARAGGLGITCHAGEWGGAAQVRAALAADPARIAHGAPAIDDPALCAELAARGVVLDLCPTSNRQAGTVPTAAAHPLGRLHRAGVRVTCSTDSRTVCDVTLPRELAGAAAAQGIAFEEIVAIQRTALEAAFLHDDEPLRDRLLHAFDEAAAGA